MKKKLYPVFLAVLIGCGFAFFLFSKVESKTINKKSTNAVAIQIGVFKDSENATKMQKNLGGVVFEDEGIFRVYYSVLNKDENIEFMTNYLSKKGINYYLKQINLNNELLDKFYEYETLMMKTNEESKLSINEELLNIYKEVVWLTTLLKEIPKSDLPRERLLAQGSSALSNEELLSIILRTGTKGESVKTLSSKILKSLDEIGDLKNLSINKLKSIKGLGTVKSITLLASLELGRRVYEEQDEKEVIKIVNSMEAYNHFAKLIYNSKQENFLVIFLNNKNRYITHKVLFKGTINMSVVHPREVFKTALLENASGVILMHNHPSGDPAPSASDDETTKIMAEVGCLMDIKVLDHIIVGPKEYYSYVEEGRLSYAQN